MWILGMVKMDDNNLLSSRFRELAQRADQNAHITHTWFLSLPEQAFFYKEVQRQKMAGGPADLQAGIFEGSHYILYGGYEEAERRMIVFLPDYLDEEGFLSGEKEEKSILTCLCIKPLQVRFADVLTHRDFLGAMMHLGIERDRIGDIVVDSQKAYVFAMRENAAFIKNELTRVKHTSVFCKEVPAGSCDIRPSFEEKEGSVAAPRLDAVIAFVFHVSRSGAQDLIKSQNVFVNALLPGNSDFLKEGDIVSVRGHGKFIFEGCGAKTKKERVIVRVKVYK